MVNGNDEINENWVNYANAIESDLLFLADGHPDKFYHGTPCDCGRNCNRSDSVLAHLNTVRQKALADSKLILLWLDLKLGKVQKDNLQFSGRQLAIDITKEGSLFPPGADTASINVLLSAHLKNVGNKEFATGFREYIMENRPELFPRFGYDFSNRELDIDSVLAMFEELGIRENIWMGDGSSNCFPKSDDKLLKILEKRDSATVSGNAPFKVFAWTTDQKSTMRRWLMLGVDIVFTNYPSRLKEVVEGEFQNSLVLADNTVDPWTRIKSSEVVTPLGRGCSQGYCWLYTSSDQWCQSTTTCSSDNDCFESNFHNCQLYYFM